MRGEKWGTKVGPDGLAERSPRTGKPIHYLRGEGKEKLPKGGLRVVSKLTRVTKKERPFLIRRIANSYNMYFGSDDWERYHKSVEDRYGKNIADESWKYFNDNIRLKETTWKPTEPKLKIGDNVTFIHKGKTLNGEVTGKEGKWLIVRQDTGREWEAEEHELEKAYAPAPTRESGREPYPYSKPKRFEVMLGHKGSMAQLDSGRFWAQRKLDGTRSINIKDGKNIMLRGRNWKAPFSDKYPEIVKDLRKVNAKSAVLDGEITFFDKYGRDVFLTALSKDETRKGRGVTAKLMLFDVLYVDNKDLRKLPLWKRDEILREIVPSSLKHVSVLGYSKRGQRTFYSSIKKLKGEGVMLKDPDSTYEHRRSYSWLKLKPMYETGADTYDCAIVGFTPGRGKYKNLLGALLLAQKVGNRWVYVGKTSGMDDSTRKELTRRLKRESVPQAQMPTFYDVEGGELEFSETETSVKPDLVVEVRSGGRTDHGILRFPEFERLRPDKNVGDAKMEISAMGVTAEEKRLLQLIKRR